MVIYDFCCASGHAFEGWFDSLEACNDQLEAGMIRCPICDDARVARQLSAPAVHVHREHEKPKREALHDTHGGRQTALRAISGALREAIAEQCEDVGPRFANEALAIHLGDADSRNIVGTATKAEEQTLDELGVSFHKVYLPRFDD